MIVKNVTGIKHGITIKCRCEWKNPKENRARKKIYIWNPATRSCKNGKYVGHIFEDSVVTCDEISKNKTETNENKEIKTVSTTSTQNKVTLTKFTSTNFDILIAFL